jgi:transposase
VRFTPTSRSEGRCTASRRIDRGLPAEVVMADTAYDADHLRQAIAAKGAIAVIPTKPSRALNYPLDKHRYAQRHLVECCFSTQAIPPRRDALRKDRPKLPCGRHSRRNHLMDAISVNTTEDGSDAESADPRFPLRANDPHHSLTPLHFVGRVPAPIQGAASKPIIFTMSRGHR